MSLERFNLIRKFRKERSFVDSTNADRIMYDTDTLQLTISFNNGAIYTYSEVSQEIYEKVVNGEARTKTAGPWGPVGKSPSVGAAIHQYLIERGVSYSRGGSFR